MFIYQKLRIFIIFSVKSDWLLCSPDCSYLGPLQRFIRFWTDWYFQKYKQHIRTFTMKKENDGKTKAKDKKDE